MEFTPETRNPVIVASEHAGRTVSIGKESGYILDWRTVEVLQYEEEYLPGFGFVELGMELQELQLISPYGEVLAAYERRTARFFGDPWGGDGDYVQVPA